MACRVTEIVVDSADPVALADWWCAVLGYEVGEREPDGSTEIRPPDGVTGPVILFGASSDERNGKLRLHLDVSPTDRDQDAELQRLLALGARPADVGQTGRERWHVLADPEGNEFCLLRTRVAPG